MTFGYKSAIAVERVVQNIQSLAKQLVTCLDYTRADCPVRHYTSKYNLSIKYLMAYLVPPLSLRRSFAWRYHC